MTKEFDARNAEKSRAVCEAMAERADTGKRVLTERERQILDMWPRFEDGEPVMVGDEVKADPIFGGGTCVARAIEFMDFTYIVKNYISEPIAQDRFEARVKRPAPKVLDADGVEIHVGDTVWRCNGIASGVVTSIDAGSLMNTTRYVDESGNEFRDAARSLTHTRPDSWDLLEMEAESIRKSIALHLGDYSPSCFKRSGDSVQDRVLALVCRAKALAGAEACR